jgi:GTPase
MSPDAALVVVGAERGIQRMTREHVGLACALRIPFLVVMTKVDMAPPDVLKESQVMLKRLLNRAGRKAFMVRGAADVEGALKCMDAGQTAFAPVFEVSCVTGDNMDSLRLFVRRLTVSRAQLVLPVEEERKEDVAEPGHDQRDESEVRDEGEDKGKQLKVRFSPVAQAGDGADAALLVPAGPLNVLIDDSFAPPGVGIVIGGTVRLGGACVGQRLFVGPSKNGEWIAVSVKSIFRQCVPSKAAYCGQHATFALKSLNSKIALRRDMFRKGMVAVNEASLEAAKRQTVFEFGAVVRVLHHATTIEKGYSPYIHVAGARESAKIVEIRDIKTNEETTARTGSEVFIRFRFLYYAQYLELGCPLIFREGDAKGCGRVTALFDADGNQLEPAK